MVCLSAEQASARHYLSDKNRFDVSSKGPSSGIIEQLLGISVAFARNVESVFYRLGLVQTSNFSCAESNVNELSSLFELICIRFGT